MKQTKPDLSEVVSSAEAAMIIGVTDRHVQRLCGHGKLPGSALKSCGWIIPLDAIRNYVPTPVGRPRKKRRKFSLSPLT